MINLEDAAQKGALLLGYNHFKSLAQVRSGWKEVEAFSFVCGPFPSLCLSGICLTSSPLVKCSRCLKGSCRDVGIQLYSYDHWCGIPAAAAVLESFMFL